MHIVSVVQHPIVVVVGIAGVTGAIGGPFGESRGFYAEGGRLWLRGHARQDIDALPWGLVDADTLEVVAVGHPAFVITPRLAEMTQDLGVPAQWVDSSTR